MTSKEPVMIIEKPYLVVKLHQRLLEVDFADGLRKQLESALEANTAIRETLGFMFQSVVPLDVPLADIQSAGVTEKGHVKIAIPFRKDLVIPLKPDESKSLVEKLNHMIPAEKARAAEEKLESERRRRELDAQQAGIRPDYRPR